MTNFQYKDSFKDIDPVRIGYNDKKQNMCILDAHFFCWGYRSPSRPKKGKKYLCRKRGSPGSVLLVILLRVE